MKQENLHALLASIIGHLHTNFSKNENQLTQLTDLLGSTLLDEEVAEPTNQEFSFQSADAFFSQNREGKKLEKIDETVKRILSNKIEARDLRVFVRDTPIRTTQLPGSKPTWAAGAKVVDTVGPILNPDGRRIWLDFYRIEKMIALYIQGQTLPSLLFKASFSSRIIKPANPELTKQYTIVPGSIWIHGKLLTNTAPADRYCGLRVKSGTISLDAAPVLTSGKLTIAPTNNIQCKIDLEPAEVQTYTPASDHGADARKSSLSLPTHWHFTANGTTRAITAIDPIEWKAYGQEAVSSWDGKQTIGYSNELNRVLIPLKTNINSFEVKECSSPFQQLSGVAPLPKSWWGLPAAQLDTANPLEADGSGAMIFQTAKGLSCIHQGQEGNESVLTAPMFVLEQGRISFTDQLSNSAGASQEMNMWKDDMNPHGTSIKLTFLNNTSLMYNCVGQGDELYVTKVDADIRTDRPVKVNGEPVDVRTKNSMLMLGANATKNVLGLFDDNILWDHTLPGTKAPVIKPIGLALENALFTVSPVNGCMLLGECDKEWKKMTKTQMLLTFGMFSYLPTLPDPYAANLGMLRAQFERLKPVRGTTAERRMWLWLICQVSAARVDDTKDDVKVAFHFGNMPGDTSMQVTDSVTPSPTDVKDVTGAPLVKDIGVIKTSLASRMLHPDAVVAMKKAAFKSGEMDESAMTTRMMVVNKTPDYGKEWDDKIGQLENDAFALLDVSSNANQMGVSFQYFPLGRMAMERTATVSAVASANTAFPFTVKDMSVYAPGTSVRAFTVPQIAWEPVFNLTPPVKPMDPQVFFNYYPNDGGPTRIFNTNAQPVPLAPIPVVDHLIDSFKNPKTQTFSFFTLPFGLKAIAIITKGGKETIKPELDKNAPKFKNNMVGGI
ncbi:MAG: hypothetical protein J7527_11435, partial [Chitinophagaceae bacterium]|nr:hypothetical protein [Chitinophagaceae bacterium]